MGAQLSSAAAALGVPTTSAFPEGKLSNVPRGAVKIIPGHKLPDGTYSSPSLLVTKAVRAGDYPNWAEDTWIRVFKAEECCAGCCKKICWCCLNLTLCCLPLCARDCNKCCKLCYECCCAPSEFRAFGMSEYTLGIPLSDVVSVTSHVKVVKRDGTNSKNNKGEKCCTCFDDCDPEKSANKVQVKVGDQMMTVNPEAEWLDEKIMKAERHVVIRINYLANSTKATASNVRDLTPEARDAALKGETDIQHIDISLFSSNEWVSKDWDAKKAEAEAFVQSITTLKSIIHGGEVGKGRNPTPEEITAVTKPGLEVVSYIGVPERPEMMKY